MSEWKKESIRTHNGNISIKVKEKGKILKKYLIKTSNSEKLTRHLQRLNIRFKKQGEVFELNEDYKKLIKDSEERREELKFRSKKLKSNIKTKEKTNSYPYLTKGVMIRIPKSELRITPINSQEFKYSNNLQKHIEQNLDILLRKRNKLKQNVSKLMKNISNYLGNYILNYIKNNRTDNLEITIRKITHTSKYYLGSKFKTQIKAILNYYKPLIKDEYIDRFVKIRDNILILSYEAVEILYLGLIDLLEKDLETFNRISYLEEKGLFNNNSVSKLFNFLNTQNQKLTDYCKN